jgi:sulfite reductase beta subunit-like hemoprotein
MILTTKQEPEHLDDPVAVAEDIQAMRSAIAQLRHGELTEEEFRKFRLHRGIYGQRADQVGYNMVRVKIPYGLLTARQLHGLSRIAEVYADGIAHITTRQDLQYHWVRLESVPAVMEDLARVGLTTREACGNTVRNIVGSPLAGVDADELFDVTPYARQLAKHLLRHPLGQQLPRKFKISFSGSPNEGDGVIPWIHDVGLVAALSAGRRRGFKVYVGGGLGSQPRVADLLEEFTPADLLIPTVEAILAIFNEFGNRENRNKARMKFVIWKMGLQEFQRLVQEERQRVLNSGRDFTAPEEIQESGYPPLSSTQPVVPNGDLALRNWLDTNVFPQKQSHYHLVYINPPIGDLTAPQLSALGEIAAQFSNGQVRTTTQQDVVLRWIRSSDLDDLYKQLRQFGLHQPGAQTIANVTSCPGADTCNLGVTHSRALGKALTALFQENSGWKDALADLRVKISGCPNSCGQHHVAALGFYGATKKAGDHQIPSYVLMLGGGFNSGKQHFGEVIGKIPARRVPEAVSRLLRGFLSERNSNESFWGYVDRVGVAQFRDRLRDLTALPSAEQDEDLFVDLGENNAFMAKTGVGECAV